MLKRFVIREQLAIYTLEIGRQECVYHSVNEIADYFQRCIEADDTARWIATFDHFNHTGMLPNGQMAESIRAAVNVVFCFGLTLQEPSQLAFRPRSIGICETDEGFSISFLETPMPVANGLLEFWAQELNQETNRTVALKQSA